MDLPTVDHPEYFVGHMDWSTLMTDLMKSLTRAEEQLRLIHMDPKHKSLARGHLMTARHTLIQLEAWCGKHETTEV